MIRMLALAFALPLAAQDSDGETLYVLLFHPGPKWEKGKPAEKQPGLSEHIAYYEGLSKKGTLVLGGPFLDEPSGMAILRASSIEEASKIALTDPAVRSGLLTAKVRPWKAILPRKAPLEDPKNPKVNLTAPGEFKIKFTTTRGDFTVKVVRDWSPRGADRFFSLAKNGFFDGCRFFRVLTGFVAQFGISGDPKISAAWREAVIEDDPVKSTNTRGRISFATGGPNTRTTQLFINFADNSQLDGMGFSPLGEVVEGMDVVEALYAGYGEGAPRGRGPDQGKIQSQGNAYLEKEFPNLDSVKSARVVE